MAVPKLRFKNYKDSWSEKPLGEIVTFLDGKRKPIKQSDRSLIQGNYPYYGASGIIDFVNDYIFDEDIILLGEDGENILSRNLPLAFKVSGRSWVNNHAHVLKPKKDNDIDFLTQKLESISYVKYNSGTAQPKLNQEICRQIPIKSPSLEEQQKIADFLTSVDDKINLLKKKKELLEQYKKGVMQKIFSQELRFKDEKGKDFPEWEEKILGDICEITKGKQLNVENMVEDGLFPALNGGITYSGYTNSWNTEKDTITVSEGGNSCGFVSFIKEDFWCGGHCYALKNIKEGVIKIYLYQNLKQNELSIMRMRVGSGLPNIQKKALAGFFVQVPDPKEQQKIADFLSALDDKIALVEQQINQTERWKKGLLQQMFV